MSSEASIVAMQYRLQEWAAQIKECQNRPAGMTVVSWCACNGITKADYYYRLRRVREACLETVQEKCPAQPVIPVGPELIQQLNDSCIQKQDGLDISIAGYSIHVTESTSLSLLASVLQVIKNAQ